MDTRNFTTESDSRMAQKCSRCQKPMSDGIALQNVYGGTPDFPGGEVVTISPTGKATIVRVLKCSHCGYSKGYEK